MPNIISIIQQELTKIIALTLVGLALQLVAISVIKKPVAIREIWRQIKLKGILGIFGGIVLLLVVFFALLSPAIPHVDGNPLLLYQNDRGQTSQGLTPTPYGPEKPKIGTTTWTPRPTYTFTSTCTPTPSPSPSHTPTPSLTPIPSGQKQTETPTRTPIPPCYSQGPFFFERPRSGEEFMFGSSVPLIMRINPEMMRQMNYTSYSIRYIPASRSKEETPLEKWDVIQARTPLSVSLIETVWTPMQSGTYWLSAALYWDGQYTANALQQCAIKVIVR